mmetsp:Transcript_6881/g.8106  ORF Transcript_6881/g.8106 Transcript_6881/m.8106 type:complete len:82 (-) Transcript_6881:93-338(-)|eukprot:Skav209842  [mRNA]  locus=scaffold2703:355214:358622:+ [translate_table: standard]
MAQKDGELVINASGVLQSKEGNWGSEVDQVVTSVWQVLRDMKHVVSSGESLKRISVSFGSRHYIITGKDSTYHVVRWSSAS